MNRNGAVLLALLAAFVLVLPPTTSAQQVPLAATKIPQFKDPLPQLVLPGEPGNGIRVVLPDTEAEPPFGTYTLRMCEFKTQVLPAGFPATSVWGYRKDDCPATKTTVVPDSYIGPVVVANRGVQTKVTYVNALGDTGSSNVSAYKLSTDQTLMWADPLHPYTNPDSGARGRSEGNACADALAKGDPPPSYCAQNYSGVIPAAPHLHGGEIPAGVDGGPDAWWTARVNGNPGRRGHGFYSTGGVTDAVDGKATYIYTNTQEPAPTWFHDHILGATRLNVYAGLAGGYVQIDPQPGNPNYPASKDLPGVTEIVPIVIQDRMFDTAGQLFFPALGINPAEHPFWIPEFVGDVIVVNGKAWPFLNVEPRKYRFLFLNGSNARAYELFLINKVTGVKGPSMFVIGTDQGYLDKAVQINPAAAKNNKLIIMPGERYEVVIDFSNNAGATLLLSNTAKTPYPAGAPANGRTTGRIMELRVGTTCVNTPCDPHSWVAANGTPVRVGGTSINRLVAPATGTVPAAVPVMKTRRLTLNEAMGPGGPLEVLVNNTKYRGDVAFAVGDPPRGDFTPVTTQWNTTWYSEMPYEGETEIWEIVNLTADAHPIHPHLVAFQLLNREAFNVMGYNAVYDFAFPGGGFDPVAKAPYLANVYMPGYGPPLDYGCITNPVPPAEGIPEVDTTTGKPCVLGGNPDPAPFLSGVKVPPLPSEAGWKDTVIAYPGQVTRIVVRFAPTTLLNTATRASGAAYEFNPNGGHGFVWHCHIIDHEDNEMMRPMSVVENPVGDRFELPQADPSNPLP